MAKKAAKSKKARTAKRPAKAARKVSPFPEGVRSLTPNLILRDCSRAIEFYKQALGAKELSRAIAPNGKSVWHASLQIGDSLIFLNDPMGQEPWKEPSGQLWVYGPDVDGRFEQAVKAGAKAVMPVADMFWGDRMGTVVDPFGQTWTLATHIRDMTAEEMRKAGEEFAKQMSAQMSAGQPTQQEARA
jgi:PhnB protein